MSDHFGDQFAPLFALGAVAVATSVIRLTMEVLCNDFRNPAVLAKEIATLDCLSDGRCELGLGAGWLAAEYKQAGLAFDGEAVPHERLHAPERKSTRLNSSHYCASRMPSSP